MCKVSIIIPAYNEEKRIVCCLNSLKKMDYDDYEIIIIDDGSTDKTLSRCIDFSETDGRISVVQSNRGGVAKARNIGLEKAIGEYVWFVDGDDEVTIDALSCMIKTMEQKPELGMCVGNYRMNNNVFGGKCVGILPIANYVEDMLSVPGFYYSVLWNKLFRMAIIRDHNIRFADTVFWKEDHFFVLEYLKYVGEIVCINNVIYEYYQGNSYNKQQTKSLNREYIIYQIMRTGYEMEKDLVERLDISNGVGLVQNAYFSAIQSYVADGMKENNEVLGPVFLKMLQDDYFLECANSDNMHGISVRVARFCLNRGMESLYMKYLKYKW